MELKIRRYVSQNHFFLISVCLGMITINVSSQLTISWFLKVIGFDDDLLIAIVSNNIWYALLSPVYALTGFYFILSKVKSNNPVFLSIMTGLTASALIGLTGVLSVNDIGFAYLLKEFFSVTILVLVWIIIIQSPRLSLINSLSSGYFAALFVSGVWSFLGDSDTFSITQSISFIISIFFIGVVSRVFGFITKAYMYIFGVKDTGSD